MPRHSILFITVVFAFLCRLVGSVGLNLRRYNAPGNLPTIRFGTPITLSSGLRTSAVSKHIYRAYELFFHWLNTQRGGISINGTSYAGELLLIDDKGSELLTKAAVAHLADDYKVKIFLGPYSSRLSNHSASVVHERGGTMIAPAAASGFVFDGRTQIFGTATPAHRFLDGAMSMLATQSPRPQRLAFLQEDTGFTKLACATLAGLATKHSMQLVHGGKVSKGAKASEVSAAVAAMATTNPDVVFGCTYDDVCRELLLAAKAQNFNPKAFVITICVPTPKYVTNLKFDGTFVFGLSSWTTKQKSVSAISGLSSLDFVKMYKERFYGEEPHYASASAWACCTALVHAMEVAESFEPGPVADALKSMKLDTIFGTVAFDSNRQNLNEMKVVQYQSFGDLSIVHPQSLAHMEPAYPRPGWGDLRCMESEKPWFTPWGHNGPSANATCGTCDESKGLTGQVKNNSVGIQVRECLPCALGKSLKMVGVEGSCSSCDRGHFWCGPGWKAPIYGKHVAENDREEAGCRNIVGSHCLMCPKGKYQDETGQYFCKECRPGTYMSKTGASACYNCTEGAKATSGVHFSARNASIECTPCPKGGLCLEDAEGFLSGYTNAHGYYLNRILDTSKVFALGKLYKCPSGTDGKACVQEAKCHIDPDNGEVAMEGPFCGMCRKGFAKGQSEETCRKCPSLKKSVALAFSGQVVLFALTVVLSVQQLLKDPRKVVKGHTVILRQFINYVHLTTVILPAVTFHKHIAEGVFSFAESFQFIGGSQGALSPAVGSECVLRHFVPDLAIHKAWTISGLIMVPCWLLLGLVLFSMLKLLCFAAGWPQPRKMYLATVATLNLFIIQPRLTRLLLIPFQCVYLDRPRLIINADVYCDSDDAGRWQLVAFCGLIVFSLGIPLSLVAILYFQFWKKGELYSHKCIQMFGFLFQGYEPKYFYFECVHMIRKVVFQLVGELPWLAPSHLEAMGGTKESLTCVSLLLLTTMFQHLHVECKPYDSRDFQIFFRIETALLRSLLATTYGQTLGYMSGHAWTFSASSNAVRNVKIRDTFITIVVVGFHLHFFALMIWGLLCNIIRKHPLYAIWWGGHSTVRVEIQEGDDGLPALALRTEGLNSTAKVCLADTIRSIVLIELNDGTSSKKGHINYKDFNEKMRKVCVQAFYRKDRAAFADRAGLKVKAALKVRKLLRHLPLAEHGWRANLDKNLTERIEGSGCSDENIWVVDPFYEYHAKDLSHVDGQSFCVTDLLMEAIRLNWKSPVACQTCCPCGHLLEPLGTSKDSGWACSGMYELGGCKSGITGFDQTIKMDRFQCLQCDYDLCQLCCSAKAQNVPQAATFQFIEGTIENAESDHSVDAFQSEIEAQAACSGFPDCPGYWKRSDGYYFRLQEGSRNWSPGSPSDAVEWVKARQFSCPCGHPLESLGTSKETGWACSGMYQRGGCRSGITGFEQTAGMNRFQCLQCDYDLCELCLSPEARDVISEERGEPQAWHYQFNEGTIQNAETNQGYQTEADAQAACSSSSSSDCLGYWKHAHGHYYSLTLGSRTWAPGSPNDAVLWVKRKQQVSFIGEWYYDVGNGSQSYAIVHENGRLFFEEGQDEEKRRGELARQEGEHKEWWTAALTELNGAAWGNIRLRFHGGQADQIQSNFHWTGKSWGKDLIATRAKMAELDRVSPLPPSTVLETVMQSAPAIDVGGVGPPDGAWSLESHGAPLSASAAGSLQFEINAALHARECIYQTMLLKDADLAELKKQIGLEHQPPPIPVSIPLQDFLDSRPVWHEDCTEKNRKMKIASEDGLGDTENMSRVSPAGSDANDMSIEPVDDESV